MPQISVIVPVYKVESYIRRCIDSILAQTYSDFELILVDDGSPDNCGVICDEYARKDSRIHVIHQQNSGLSAARNAGIDWTFLNSDSEWLTFIDSDDWVNKQYLEALLCAALDNDVNVSICAYQETDGRIPIEDNEQGDAAIWKPEDFFVQHHVNATVAWGKLYKKECFREIRYPVGKLHEDEFVTYRILFKQIEVAVIDVRYYYYFQNNNGIMRSPWSHQRLVAIEAHKEQIEYFEKNNFQRAKMCSARSYVGVLCGWLKMLREGVSSSWIPGNEKEVLSLLRMTLKEYREQVPFDECQWAWTVAYPTMTKCRDITKRLWKHTIGRWKNE